MESSPTIPEVNTCVQAALEVTKFYMSCFLSTLLAIALAAVSFVPVSSPAAQTIEPDPPLATQLRKSDDLLLKAVHTADRAAWQTFAAPDFFYLDEEGGVTYLDTFLRQLQPMTSKPLQIQTYKLTRALHGCRPSRRHRREQRSIHLYRDLATSEWRLETTRTPYHKRAFRPAGYTALTSPD